MVKKTNNAVGTLYVVATPIGNLKDISARGIEILQLVDVIAAEDTRHAGSLLKHYSIQKPTISLHEFNEREKYPELVDQILAGTSVALVSDAGTPLISDPGFRLVREAKQQNIDVVPIPGACAAITALSAAGLPCDRFTFEGFLPAKNEARENVLSKLLHEERTMIFYEAPHRLLASLESMSAVFGQSRQVVVARELTKIHESIIAGSLAELVAYYQDHKNEQKGEIVIIVHGVEEKELDHKEVNPDEVLSLLMKELPLKQAASLASKITGVRKNDLYQKGLALKDNTL